MAGCGRSACTSTPPRPASRHRTWADVRLLLDRLPEPLRTSSAAVFDALARAEADVHGVRPEEVHFHEVGALDAIADVVGVCAGFAALGLDRLVVSPIALGGGSARHRARPHPGAGARRARAAGRVGGAGARGARRPGAGHADRGGPGDPPSPTPGARCRRCGSPGPASVPAAGTRRTGPTPSGWWWGSRPLRRPARRSSYCWRRPSTTSTRGRGRASSPRCSRPARGTPGWTPVLMKKGRPAHVVTALAGPEAAETVRAVLFAETPTLGVRETPTRRHALARAFRTVDVDGVPVAVKLGLAADGRVLNAMPEWEDVVRAAAALDRPVKQVLAQALGLAAQLPPRRARRVRR